MRDAQGPEPDAGVVRRLMAELRRRRVVRTLFWYVGVSVAVVEGAEAFTQPLGLPGGAVRVLAILAVAGLPLMLALAWAYELSPDAAASVPMPTSTGRQVLVSVAVMISVATVAVLWSWTSSGRAPSSVPADASTMRLAVLPLDARGTAGDLGPLADYLHGRLIEGLSAVSRTADREDHLRVISRAGVLPFVEARVRLDSLARALDVGLIVGGSIESSTGGYRVHVELIDPMSGEVLGDTTRIVAVDEEAGLVDELSDAALQLLRRQIGSLIEERQRRSGTQSREAFRLVVEGERASAESFRALRARNLEGARNALEFADSVYARAEALDPRWVEPIARRGWLADHWARLEAAEGRPRSRAVYESGLAHAERALSLRAGDYTALQLRGFIRSVLADLTSDPDSLARLRTNAEADLRAAVRLNPLPATALRRLSELLAGEGRLEEALEIGERSYLEDPYQETTPQSVFRLFEYSLRLGRDSTSARWCGQGATIFPTAMFEDCRLSLMAWTDLQPPSPDSAWASVARELDAYPQPLHRRLEPRLHGMVAAVLARAGRPDSARAVVVRAEATDPATSGMALTAAGVHLLLGDTAAALTRVESLLDANPSMRDVLPGAPELRGLRGNPSFLALLGERNR